MLSSCGCCYCIPQATVGIVENLGQFTDVKPPGLACVNPCSTAIRGPVSLKTKTMVCNVTSRTSERSVMSFSATIVYRVIPSKVHLAFYSMSNPSVQITTMVENVLRAQIPNYTLNEVYLNQSEIANKAMIDLSSDFEEKYGHRVIDLLVTDIRPAHELVSAMNQQVVERLNRVVAQHKGDMVRIEQKAAAEADAEAKRLSGVGLAAMRDSLAKGMTTGFVGDDRSALPMSEQETMAVILMDQYFDTAQQVASAKNSRVIFSHKNLLPPGINKSKQPAALPINSAMSVSSNDVPSRPPRPSSSEKKREKKAESGIRQRIPSNPIQSSLLSPTVLPSSAQLQNASSYIPSGSTAGAPIPAAPPSGATQGAPVPAPPPLPPSSR